MIALKYEYLDLSHYSRKYSAKGHNTLYTIEVQYRPRLDAEQYAASDYGILNKNEKYHPTTEIGPVQFIRVGTSTRLIWLIYINIG